MKFKPLESFRMFLPTRFIQKDNFSKVKIEDENVFVSDT